MHSISKLLWSAALHFFKVLACAMDAKLATMGPAGSLGIYIVREADRQTGIKEMREKRSQVPLLAKGHWCVYKTLRAHTHTYRI